MFDCPKCGAKGKGVILAGTIVHPCDSCFGEKEVPTCQPFAVWQQKGYTFTLTTVKPANTYPKGVLIAIFGYGVDAAVKASVDGCINKGNDIRMYFVFSDPHKSATFVDTCIGKTALVAVKDT